MSEAESYEQVQSVPTETRFRLVEGLGSVPSAEREQFNPQSGTVYANGNRRKDDEWSDENLRMWEEEDKLDPDLAEWLQAQRLQAQRGE